MKRMLSVLLLAASSAVLAESGAYRVEVIVFRNLAFTTAPTAVAELRSFSQFPDPQEQLRPEAANAELSGDPDTGMSASPDGTLPGNLPDNLPFNLPDNLRVPAQKSTTMDDVWRRLRSSQTWQPLVYAAWEQNRVDYYPPMRIHDGQLIDTELRPPTAIIVADLTSADPLATYRSTFYRLDGSLQLRRSRFLHLDLEFREKNPPEGVTATFPGGNGGVAGTANSPDMRAGYGVYTLNQNRQVSTGEMQYFDTPFLGALVYVTGIP